MSRVEKNIANSKQTNNADSYFYFITLGR